MGRFFQRACLQVRVPVVLSLTLVFGPGLLQSDETQNARRSKPNNDVRNWLDRVTGPQFAISNQRDSGDVKQAFREVVADARKYTVRVLADESQVALGTIVDKDGFIVTKASEMRGKLTCKMFDGRRLPATIVGENKDHDLALIKVDASELPVVQWRSGQAPAAGSWLATAGQDELPEAIGVVSAASRKVTAPKGMLGVLLDESESGPKVLQVMPGSAAERANLRVDDVITHINGKASGKRQSLVDSIQKYLPGDTVDLKVLRGEENLTLKATLGDRNAGPHSERAEFQNSLGGKLSDRRAGFPLALQHDTVLRPNLCGGPVVDLEGRAVGINIARAGRVASYALPENVIQPFLSEMRATKLAAGAAGSAELVDTKKMDSE